MKTKSLLTTIIVASLFIFTNCSPRVYLPMYHKYTLVNLTANDPAEKTQGNITIKLQPINDKEYEKALYKQPVTIIYKGLLDGSLTPPMTAEVDYVIPLFHKMTAFEVTVVNNTSHILRMKDSRVIYVDPDKDEPLFAYDKNNLLDDVENLEGYKHTFNSINRDYRIADKEALKISLAKATKKVADKISFVNGFNKEIMPSMKATGLIIFPIDPVLAQEGKVSFVDIVSETDQAGNPSKRVRFDYRVAAERKYFKSAYDPTSRKYLPYQETTEEDYNAGTQKPK